MARRGARPALRLVALLASFTLVFALVAGRLVQLQVVQAEPLEKIGAKQRIRKVEIPAKRGAIFDRNMTPLAVSTEARAIYANPRFVDDAAVAARLLAPVLGIREGILEDKLSKDAGFVYLARRVPPTTADQVLALDLPFVGTLRETQRSYPADALAGQILGFVGIDDQGLSGLESRFESVLAGTAGHQVVEQDPQGRPITHGHNSIKQPVPGRGLALTLDRDIQFFAESALERGARATKARSGVAIVLDTVTGEVLAMANWPPLNPNAFADATPDQRRNRAVTDVYEPGSVNKVVTAAAAIEAGLIMPSKRMRVADRIRVAGRLFRDFENHPTETLTFAEALARSSNVGTIKVALRLGPHRLHRALQAFGLGRETGIGFPGESSGILLPPTAWYPTSIATIPIGQGIAVTPLQVASVYATIANDGVRMQPRLIRGTVEHDGTLVPTKQAKPRRVVSAYTAAQVRAMLVAAVEQGTGQRARIPGYLVGGKTGTARIPMKDKRGYSNDIITTFAGMAPADDPRLVVLVSLENPRPRLASMTAAPVFREIMAFALGKLGIPPTVAVRDPGSLLQRRARPLPSPSPSLDRPRERAGTP